MTRRWRDWKVWYGPMRRTNGTAAQERVHLPRSAELTASYRRTVPANTTCYRTWDSQSASPRCRLPHYQHSETGEAVQDERDEDKEPEKDCRRSFSRKY